MTGGISSGGISARGILSGGGGGLSSFFLSGGILSCHQDIRLVTLLLLNRSIDTPNEAKRNLSGEF